jgi:Phospholipase_D-nuclease N-terminal
LFLDEGIVGLLLFMFWIWAILDVISTDSAMARNLPKMTWLIIVIILPDIGAIAWLLLGRPERASWRPGSTDYTAPRRPVGLEDSPRYSASPEVSDRRSEELNLELDRWEREQRATSASAPAEKSEAEGPSELDAWQEELDRREAELRRRELELRQRELDQRELDQRERDIDQ